ncbi:fatty acyl-AMP ligase [Fluoribacter dumoffii]|uniref:fatty acyl-AMP ligase n=1 Tax=Fluoribacter dumoffii TaxID=463 RepID=UPI002242DAF5|nr:fatty acyl-AMP ligase [Fluoribacter dumoffii]MCW8418168.1 fatty acyl-AMP ligase [Fluoribacter dumoffii]MCW8453990.1 fatty acyl-AMP ligase [Fluoribacter dumoffii]MCW8461939.1 fatty acyl-AMP ligase [Fluoribacter dumoffii]MCW8482151.1 fatty acyl-AMP ligase [Fluoribacter dumoffii]
MSTRKKFNNVVDLFSERCREKPSDPLYYFSATGFFENSECLTYGELQQKIHAIAALIQEYSKPGERVLLIFSPGIDYIITFWACLFSGVLAVPAYPPFDKSTVEKLQAIINNSKPSIILSNTEITQKIKKLGFIKNLASIPLIQKFVSKFSGKINELMEWDFENFRWIDINKASADRAEFYKPQSFKSSDMCYLQYTSGSTSMPKGVIVRHGNLLDNLSLVYETIGETSHERMVSWLPPYHDMGLIGNLLFPVYADFSIFMMSPISFLRHPYLWLKAISDFEANISGGPNFAYEICEKRIDEQLIEDNLKLHSWRVAYNGAEYIHHKTLNHFYNKFSKYGFQKHSFYPIYGLAESTVFVSGNKKENENPHLLHVDIDSLNQNKIVLSDGRENKTSVLVGCGKPMVPTLIVSKPPFRICAEGEIGEIWLHGPSVTSGYWENDEATRDAFHADLKEADKTKYLRTGDLGFLHQGNLYITGRIKELIIINGKNHYPYDIELFIGSLDPRLKTGCIAAVSINGNDSEQLAIVAEVRQLFPPHELEEIANTIKTNISSGFGLSPHFIALIPPKKIPKTTSGKLRRNIIKKLVADNGLNPLYLWQAGKCNYDE